MKKKLLTTLLVCIQFGLIAQINSVQIGTSSNVYTFIRGESNQIIVNQDLNTVIFIHRNDASVFGGESAQFRYDISTNGGISWTTDIGVLNPSGTNAPGGPAGRYPQVAIYNPIGNTDPDSSYLTYLSAYHSAGVNPDIWDGTITGVARLDGASTTWTETNTLLNGGDVLIPNGFCKGASGVYWAADWVFDNSYQISDLIVYKAVWNDISKDINIVIDTIIQVPFDISYDGIPKTNSLNMAFDSSGQYGWIAFSGHVAPVSEYIYTPVFYRTTNGGNSWEGPTVLDLRNFNDIIARMSIISDTISTAFDADLGVDGFGDPHFVTVVAPALTYSIFPIGMEIYDFTYSSNRQSWGAYYLDSVLTLRGDFTTTIPPISEDNRPQVCIGPNGDKVFITWLDSDPLITGPSPNNNYAPNLIAVGIDVVNNKRTPTVNFTMGDPTWDGAALYASISPTGLRNGTNNIVPTVTMELNVSQSAYDPTTFHYFTNVAFEDSLFKDSLVFYKDTVTWINVPYVQQEKTDINVYPNPFSTSTTITINSEIVNLPAEVSGTQAGRKSEIRLVMYDVLGREVKKFKVQSEKFKVGRGNLPNGMYFYKIATNDGIIGTGKLVITDE